MKKYLQKKTGNKTNKLFLEFNKGKKKIFDQNKE